VQNDKSQKTNLFQLSLSLSLKQKRVVDGGAPLNFFANYKGQSFIISCVLSFYRKAKYSQNSDKSIQQSIFR
jgi:hypothetical protein